MKIYTDGACRGNQNVENFGAWSFVVVDNDTEIAAVSGFQPNTTNNKMEMAAVIAALNWVTLNHRGTRPVIISDSQYVVKGITEWIHGWIKKNWVNSIKKPVENRSQWEIMHSLNSSVKAQFQWIRGHDGDKYNEMCDKMCNDLLDSLTLQS